MYRRIVLLALALCLLLCACTQQQSPPVEPAPVRAEQTQTPPPPQEKPDDPISLGRLAVEVVVGWEETDRILSGLDQLSRQLAADLLERGYAAEEVAVTISTAGAYTAGALAEGGVDIACMSPVDCAACQERAEVVLTTGSDCCTGLVAVTNGRAELDEAFRHALAEAMAADEGFLSICYPGQTYMPASEEAVQTILNLAAEQQEAPHGA